MTSPVIHFEIGGRDLSRMASFYGELLGWQLRPDGDPPHRAVRHDRRP
jgi:predicted enzyme related to lactoylglutathione lyase